MITVWNRREVYVGYDLEKFAIICSILRANQIKYISKTVNRNRHSAYGRQLGIGVKDQFINMRSIYVHKKDFDYACHIVAKNDGYR